MVPSPHRRLALLRRGSASQALSVDHYSEDGKETSRTRVFVAIGLPGGPV